MFPVRLVPALLLVAVTAPAAYASPNCTAEQGQLLIDQARYKQAIGELRASSTPSPLRSRDTVAGSRRSFAWDSTRVRSATTRW